MKKLGILLTAFSVIITLLFSMQAEAKKFGGGRSFGQSYRTAPAQPAKASPMGSPSANPAAAPQRGGMLKGMLGGLVAGGLLAWLFSSGAFSGIQPADILIIAAIAFCIFMFLRRKKVQSTPQPAGGPFGRQAPQQFEAHHHIASNNTTTSTQDIPFDLPADFDIRKFTDTAREHFLLLQKAWDEHNFTLIAEYVSPGILRELEAERRNEPQASKTEVLYLETQLVRATHTPAQAELSLLFTGKCKDQITGEEELIHDVWHLQRNLQQPNAPWIIIGIQGE
jgi:predicted lipid-binding transport protein (Tim44 family)